MKYLPLLAVFVLLAGCTTAIGELKTEDMIGETVTISGTVQNTVKIGSLSGFTLEDESGSIGVSSQALPAEGDEVRVKGVLVRDSIFGYYIKADSIR